MIRHYVLGLLMTAIEHQISENQQHRVNLRYDMSLDSLNLITLRGNATKEAME